MLNLVYILALLGGGGDIPVHWSFDAIDNDTIAESGFGLDASVHGAYIQQGALHGALYFDGVDDFAEVLNINGVQKTIGTFNEGTISGWFRFDNDPGLMKIEPLFYVGAEETFSNFGTSTNCYELEVGHFSSQRRLYWTNIETFDEQTEIPLCWSTTNHLQTGQWHHIASTTSETGTHVYLNNEEIFGSGDLTWQFGDETIRRFIGDVVSQEVVWFGKGLWNNEHQFFEGVIDEFKIWNRALSQEEVAEEYERVAMVGFLVIDNAIPEELVTNGSFFDIHGTYENIVQLKWRIGSSGDWVITSNTSLDQVWSLAIQQTIPAGRSEIKIVGKNASNRSFIDTRVLVNCDLDENGSLNVQDLLQLIAAWGDCDCVEDLTGDGRVSIADILLLISAWG